MGGTAALTIARVCKFEGLLQDLYGPILSRVRHMHAPRMQAHGADARVVARGRLLPLPADLLEVVLGLLAREAIAQHVRPPEHSQRILHGVQTPGRFQVGHRPVAVPLSSATLPTLHFPCAVALTLGKPETR